jgi:hypothetical protein
LTEAPSARPTAFTSSSGSGSAHAHVRAHVDAALEARRRILAHQRQLRDLRGQRGAALRERDRLRGIVPDAAPFSMSVAPSLRAVASTSPIGAKSCAHGSSRVSLARRAARRRANGIAGGPSAPASVIDSITRTSAMPSA